jgi:DNA-binding MarR family transcriptional regulator
MIVAMSVRLRFFIQRMESDQRVIVQFLCKERVSPEDNDAHLEAQFGDATCGEWNIRPRCQYVRQRPKDLHDEVPSGRPPIDFRDIRILALLDEQPFHSAYSIAEALGVSHSTILSHLRELVGMKSFHLRWIPHELTTSLRQIWMEICRDSSPILKAHQKNTFQRSVTGDESCLTWNFVILRDGAYREMTSVKR